MSSVLVPPVAPFCPSCQHLASFVLQEDERYEQVGDVRTQLKFFEQLDQMEKQRKEEQEREILLKAAKVTTYKQELTFTTDRKKPAHCLNRVDMSSELSWVSVISIHFLC